ncbi:hypothetical protein [Micromonospora costi]|uniref:hypothetical protein n=1 Tax=Micromonospora costi TaxID=1530042 RepID=UPI0011C3B349|nr:hypothetical protein [Micromonospora costi]
MSSGSGNYRAGRGRSCVAAGAAGPRAGPEATPPPDLVNRNFTAAGPNRPCVADATGIHRVDGVFWLAPEADVKSLTGTSAKPKRSRSPVKDKEIWLVWYA